MVTLYHLPSYTLNHLPLVYVIRYRIEVGNGTRLFITSNIVPHHSQHGYHSITSSSLRQITSSMIYIYIYNVLRNSNYMIPYMVSYRCNYINRGK